MHSGIFFDSIVAVIIYFLTGIFCLILKLVNICFQVEGEISWKIKIPFSFKLISIPYVFFLFFFIA